MMGSEKKSVRYDQTKYFFFDNNRSGMTYKSLQLVIILEMIENLLNWDLTFHWMF